MLNFGTISQWNDDFFLKYKSHRKMKNKSLLIYHQLYIESNYPYYLKYVKISIQNEKKNILDITKL